jgi:hypothetical protein
VCFGFGGSRKLKNIGINNIDKKNIPIMFNAATIPNSVNILLLVIINVANPDAVVRLVKNMAFPVF